MEGALDPSDDRSPEDLARAIAAERAAGLNAWGITEADVRAFRETTAIRVITPGSSAGEPLHVLASLERRFAPSTVGRRQ